MTEKKGIKIAVEPLFKVTKELKPLIVKSISVKDGCVWDSHVYGCEIGYIYSDKTQRSLIRKDIENNDTKLFSEIIKSVECTVSHKTIFDKKTGSLTSIASYALPYKVKGHKAYLPTVTDEYIGNSMNMSYEAEMEILFTAEDGYVKYVYLPWKTDGPHTYAFCDQLESIEDSIIDMFISEDNGFRIEDECGKIYCATFYNKIGEGEDLEFENLRELMRMITSVRMVSLKSTIHPIQSNK